MGLLIMLAIVVTPIVVLILMNKNNEKIKAITDDYDKRIADLTINYEKRLLLAEQANDDIKNEYQSMFDDIHYKALSYTDLNEIIDSIVDELWNQKYQMNYLLRGVDIIPDMDGDIAEMAKEVTASINSNLWANIHRYYDSDYFGAMIVRRVQLLFIDYINRHKPPTK
jgi:hypothetical protein